MNKHQKLVACINVGFNFHGGGGSALYKFCSSRTVADAKHRKETLEEIKDCYPLSTNEEDTEKLKELFKIVKKAQLGKELLTYKEWAEEPHAG